MPRSLETGRRRALDAERRAGQAGVADLGGEARGRGGRQGRGGPRARGARRGRPESCPRCGCPAFVKKGTDRDGSQRWLCRGCGQTFSAKTMSPPGYSELKPGAWLGCVSDMLSGPSLRACAEPCGVSLKTSWSMRMRLCEAMARAALPFRTGESASRQVDGTCVSANVKPADGGGTENPYQTTTFGRVACTRSSRGKGLSSYTSGTAGRPRRRCVLAPKVTHAPRLPYHEISFVRSCLSVAPAKGAPQFLGYGTGARFLARSLCGWSYLAVDTALVSTRAGLT